MLIRREKAPKRSSLFIVWSPGDVSNNEKIWLLLGRRQKYKFLTRKVSQGPEFTNFLGAFCTPFHGGRFSLFVHRVEKN